MGSNFAFGLFIALFALLIATLLFLPFTVASVYNLLAEINHWPFMSFWVALGVVLPFLIAALIHKITRYERKEPRR